MILSHAEQIAFFSSLNSIHQTALKKALKLDKIFMIAKKKRKCVGEAKKKSSRG